MLVSDLGRRAAVIKASSQFVAPKTEQDIRADES
jgi:hypothetical protein